jgi:hypothetical protein
MIPTPSELDEQSEVHLDGWVYVDSERWREVDDDPTLTKRWLRLGFMEPAFLFTDAIGRVWGQGNGGKWYPYHLEYGKKKFGIRISTKAPN